MMTNTIESLAPEPIPSERMSVPVIPAHGRADSPTAAICDLAKARPFASNYEGLHVPILVAFGGDRLHECRLSGLWDLKRAVVENTAALYRSIRRLPNQRDKDRIARWDDLTFQFGPRTFLYADITSINGYASTPLEAARLVTWFSKTYSLPRPEEGGAFYLIQQESTGVGCQKVPLSPDTILSDGVLRLHYGSGSEEWHQDFVEKLRDRMNGLSIFEGSPGTGKTCYLRHLMGVLKDSHRFYFIPTSTMGVLSRPDFIGFWTDQRRIYSDRKFVVVLEDSDAALMTRGSDNREQVSAILNLSDGMLADFLRLQIICTINYTVADIDQALLRPGRLLCHRVFSKLDYPQAVRLAESLGRKLPVARDYSLAEVFAGHDTNDNNHSRIGFDA